MRSARTRSKGVVVAGVLVMSLASPIAASARPAGTTTVKVAVKDFFFRPDSVTIAKGTAIKWVNRGAVKHTTTSDTGLWSKKLLPGDSFRLVFDNRGTFDYHCRFHPSMTGTITVT